MTQCTKEEILVFIKDRPEVKIVRVSICQRDHIVWLNILTPPYKDPENSVAMIDTDLDTCSSLPHEHKRVKSEAEQLFERNGVQIYRE